MEPIEWLVLGIGLALGGLFGAKGKDVVKTTAKSCMVAGEKVHEWSSNIREDLKNVVEEARNEKEQDEASAS